MLRCLMNRTLPSHTSCFVFKKPQQARSPREFLRATIIQSQFRCCPKSSSFFLHELLSLSQKCRNHTLADSMPELRFAEDTIFGITFAFIVGFVILPTAWTLTSRNSLFRRISVSMSTAAWNVDNEGVWVTLYIVTHSKHPYHLQEYWH